MTQTLENPNNNELAKSSDRNLMNAAAVFDSGEFSLLLDTGKFNHLWRVAQLFSRSALVPQHFQNKPEDCFIAAQMAIRLRVDPFMFMQNTYVLNGKPGMEGKLAIALINSSGLFKGPLRYEFSGEGDDLGCVAWGISTETNERVTGPRVTIAIAKSEGWYTRNPKWKTIADLMLRYRAGAWFGRLNCPERLMGMQTIEELEDIRSTEAARAVQSITVNTRESVERINQQTGEVTGNGAPGTSDDPFTDQPQARVPDSSAPTGEDQPAAPDDGSQQQTWPEELPEHAHTDQKWIDDAITMLRPANKPAVLARREFHVVHSPQSWTKLSREQRQNLYRQLVDGSFARGSLSM